MSKFNLGDEVWYNHELVAGFSGLGVVVQVKEKEPDYVCVQFYAGEILKHEGGTSTKRFNGKQWFNCRICDVKYVKHKTI